MRCYSLTLGARNTRSAQRYFHVRDDHTVRKITERHFPDGFTILEADGGWFDPTKRRFIKEESRQLLVCAKSLRPVKAWCRELAIALHQKELLVIELGAAQTLKFPAAPNRGRADYP